MRVFLFLGVGYLLLLSIDCEAQFLTCEESLLEQNVICGLNSLDTYSGSTPDFVNAGPGQPNPLCSGNTMTVPNNIVWWSFVAGATTIEGEFEVTSCQDNAGVQFGVYEDCGEWDEIVYCASNCQSGGSGVFEFTLNNLIVGEIYHLFVDGCNGDVCDYEIGVSSGGEAPPPLQGPQEINEINPGGTLQVCRSPELFTLTADEANLNDATFEWEVDGQVFNTDTDNTLDYLFDANGTYQVCVRTDFPCNTGDNQICINVNVSQEPDEMASIFLCEGDTEVVPGYTYADGSAVTVDELMVPQTTLSDVVNAGNCFIDLVVDIDFYDENDANPTMIEVGLCPEDTPYTLADGQTTSSCLMTDMTISSAQGCDSFLTYDIVVLDGQLTQSGDIICFSGEYTITALFTEADNGCTPSNVTYQWLDPQGDPIDGANGLVFSTTVDGAEPVTYTLTATMEVYGTICDIDPLDVTIDPTQFLAPDPGPISGPDVLCVGEIADYSVPDLGVDVTNYTWIPPAGASFIGTNDGNEVTIDFTGASSGQLCLISAETPCGSFPGDPVCYDIEVVYPPVAIAGPDQAVCGDSTVLEGVNQGEMGMWTQVSGPGTASFDQPDDGTSSVVVDQYGSYVFEWEVSIGDCPATDEVAIEFLEPFGVSAPITSCFGETSYVVTFSVQGGTEPFVLLQGQGSIDADGVFVSDAISTGTDYNFLLADGSLCADISVQGPSEDCQCDTEAGTMDNAILSLCDGDTARATVVTDPVSDGDDTTSWILHDSPTGLLGNILDQNATGEFVFDSDLLMYGASYYISIVIGTDTSGNGTVDLSDPCLGVAPGQEVIWFQLPESDAGVNDTYCEGPFLLEAIPSQGMGVWSLVDGPGPINFADPSDPETTGDISGVGLYTLQWTEDNNGCVDSATVQMELFDSPTLTQVNTQCNEAADSFVVNFEIVGGTEPYFLMPQMVQLSGSSFTSAAIPRGELVTIVIQDSNACPVQVDLTDNCVCESQVGEVTLDTLELCVGDETSISYDSQGQILDADDTTNFVLHTSSDTTLGMVLGQNANGIFSFDMTSMTAGTVYYISAVVGDDFSGSGVVSLTDGCLSVSAGTPVLWNDFPMVDFPELLSTCMPNFSLTAPDPSPLMGTWQFIGGPSTPIITNVNDPVSSVAGADIPGVYSFLWTLENGDCLGGDTLFVELLGVPEVDTTSLSYSCNSTNESYIVTFDISGGDTESYQVDGLPGGNLDGSTYTSSDIPSGTSVTVTVSDQNSCGDFQFSIGFECPCVTMAGQMEDSVLDFCEDQTAIADYNAGSETLDGNDILSYALKTENDQSLGEVLAVNTIPEFSFDATSMEYATVYYIVPLAGNDGGQGLVDTSSGACFDVGVGQGVQWFQEPEAQISSSSTTLTCAEPQLQLSAANSTPSGLSYAWLASSGGVIVGPSDMETVTVSAAGLYTLQVFNGPCVASTSVSISFDGELPTADAGPDRVLTCTDTILVLDGTGSDAGDIFQYEWIDPAGTVVGTDITVAISEPGSYVLQVLNTETGCPATSQVEVTADIEEPQIIISSVEDLTCQSESAVIDATGSDSGDGFDILWTTSNGNILSGATGLTPSVDRAGQYVLRVTNTNTGCFSEEIVDVLEIGNTFSNFDVQSLNVSCFGEADGEVMILVDGGTPPIEFSIDGGNSYSSSGIYSSLPGGEYNAVVRDANGCELSLNVIIEEPEQLEVSLPADTVIDLGESLTIAPINIIAGSNLLYNWSSTTDTSQLCADSTCTSVSVSPLVPTVYTLMVSSVSGCVDSDDIFVGVQVNRQFYFPNAFSPNADGINDFFGGFGGQTVDRIDLLQVFDRWGSLVYEGRNLPPNAPELYGWDGRTEGQELPAGVYIYNAQVRFRDGFRREIYGDVTLIR